MIVLWPFQMFLVYLWSQKWYLLYWYLKKKQKKRFSRRYFRTLCISTDIVWWTVESAKLWSICLTDKLNVSVTEHNAIFGKIGRLASEEVILELVKNKCMPCLLYGLACYTLPTSSLRSLDFIVVRFLMKLFKTVNNESIRECCSYFKFTLPSELLDNRRVKFRNNFMLCTGILHYFGIKL